ncbi:MAG: asparagine synthase (glutamine-hydrolyzing) [Rhodospirillales bacterium]|jgi:asparagine synthase (glutamine-hydrolysing)|nr:asparagine synthase (glutamine-hydrolyzing) [Rhodospirillales bacterium]
MCGLAGIFDRTSSTAADVLESRATAMERSLAHRGPDDRGVWTDAACGVALVHRRLAIIDLAPSGHQPMISTDGRFVIAYNGEIYNYKAIGAELTAAGRAVVGGSDTAVLLEACALWGVERALEKCIGMFAFALWDRQTRCLTLARDRLGIKPMFWARFGELFLFGSELKALAAHGGWRGEIDHGALAAYFRYAYVPAPYAIFKGVRKLEPGRILTICSDGEPVERTYWDLRRVAGDGAANPFAGSYGEALDEVESLLLDAVGKRLVADVPLGAFLSGGVDSSAVVALMQAQSDRPIRSFSIGFHEQAYNEATHAKAVATHLGTDHTELYVTSGQALDTVPELPRWYDEPFADSSQIPTLLLSRLTRRYVTVSLSGDGGDEVFAGYNRYLWAERIRRAVGWMPRGVRAALKAGLTAVPPGGWDAVCAVLPRRLAPVQAGDKVHKIAAILEAGDIDGIYRRLVSQWPDPGCLMPGVAEAGNGALGDERPDDIGCMQLADMASYLPDDILTKVDRASMAVALEARVPLLDHRVVEFAWRLPRRFMVRGGQSKAILRDILYKYVPRSLIERPKMGFGVPIDAWLRGPLRDWAEDLLDERRLTGEGLLAAGPIRKAWAEHLSGAANRQHALWTVLMFQSWRAHWGRTA